MSWDGGQLMDGCSVGQVAQQRRSAQGHLSPSLPPLRPYVENYLPPTNAVISTKYDAPHQLTA